jgi:hypothetical protein
MIYTYLIININSKLNIKRELLLLFKLYIVNY